MLKETIKYVDFDGIQREEDFYFNLTKAELTEWEASHLGGLSTMLTRIVKEKNVTEIMAQIKDFILRTYGEKSDDGKYFMKSADISNKFYCCGAYNELFLKIIETPESAMNFINGCLPEEVRKEIEAAKVQADNPLENAKN